MISRGVWGAAAGCLTLCLASVGQQGGPKVNPEGFYAPQPVTIRATTAKAEFRPLEPIVLKITIKSESRYVIHLDNDDNVYRRFRIIVTDARGKRVARTRYAETMLSVGSGGFDVRVEPHRTLESRVVANAVSDMTAPGDYLVVVETPMWVGSTAVPPRATLRTAPIKVRVAGGPFGADD